MYWQNMIYRLNFSEMTKYQNGYSQAQNLKKKQSKTSAYTVKSSYY